MSTLRNKDLLAVYLSDRYSFELTGSVQDEDWF